MGRADEVERLHSPAMVRFFTRTMERRMAASFHAVRLARPGASAIPGDRPLVVYANHPSWWDPALFLVLAKHCFPGRIGFGPMEAAQLGRYRFFRRLGLFGVAPGPRAGLEFLAMAVRLLERPGRMLWLTPEGVFTDPRSRPPILKGGLAHLAARLPDAVVLPLAVEYPFWNESRPEALCRFGTPLDLSALPGRSPAALNDTLAKRLDDAMEKLAALACARDPAPFDTVLEGRAGIGGFYDLWRRGRALLSGRRFDAAHGASREARAAK